MVASSKLLSLGNQFFIPGHTHNIVDQRFSIAGPAIKQADKLETPDDFGEVIGDAIKPTEGREIHIEKLEATHDWQEYFEPLSINIRGLVAVAGQPNVNYEWRVVRRGEIPTYVETCQDKASWSIEEPKDTWVHIAPPLCFLANAMRWSLYCSLFLSSSSFPSSCLCCP